MRSGVGRCKSKGDSPEFFCKRSFGSEPGYCVFDLHLSLGLAGSASGLDFDADNDSVTCRGCHEEASIRPQRKRGQRQHEETGKTGMTWIDCRYSFAHEKTEPKCLRCELSGTGVSSKPPVEQVNSDLEAF